MYKTEPTEIGDLLLQGRVDHWIDTRSHHLVKAPIMFALMFFSIYTLSGSPLKAAVIGAFSVFASLFATWRRLIEPFVVIMFCIATIIWVAPNLASCLMR